VQISFGSGAKSYPLCPYCYNYPALDEMTVGMLRCFESQSQRERRRLIEAHVWLQGMGCNECTHPTCVNGMAANEVTRCDECDTGVVVLNVNSAPKWRLECNKCNFVIRTEDNTIHSTWRLHAEARVDGNELTATVHRAGILQEALRRLRIEAAQGRVPSIVLSTETSAAD